MYVAPEGHGPTWPQKESCKQAQTPMQGGINEKSIKWGQEEKGEQDACPEQWE